LFVLERIVKGEQSHEVDIVLIYFDELDLFIGIVLLLILLPVLWWKKHNLSYLLFFSVFWVYLLVVVQSVIFPIYISLGDGGIFSPSINLIPFYFGRDCLTFKPCITGIIDNILLTIPFGFGIHFLIKVKPRRIPWLMVMVGLGFELAQLGIALIFRSGFRTVDINDVILNATGVFLGYAFFRGFTWGYLEIIGYLKIKPRGVFADIYDIALLASSIDKSGKAES
jgi:glycopeptide antibiotics resistance protein